MKFQDGEMTPFDGHRRIRQSLSEVFELPRLHNACTPGEVAKKRVNVKRTKVFTLLFVHLPIDDCLDGSAAVHPLSDCVQHRLKRFKR